MSSEHTDHRGDPEGRDWVGDIHDIRALTDTGAITLPRQHHSTTDGARTKRTGG